MFVFLTCVVLLLKAREREKRETIDCHTNVDFRIRKDNAKLVSKEKKVLSLILSCRVIVKKTTRGLK